MSTPPGVMTWALPSEIISIRHRAPTVVHEWNEDPDANVPGKNSFVHDLRLKALLSYTVVFGLLYCMCFLVPYGMTDSYTKLYQSIHRTLWYDDRAAIEGGRPLLALLTHVSFSPLHSYEDLTYLRVFSILGIVILAWILHQVLLLAAMRKYPAAIIPVLICVTPAFQVFAAWAVCAYYPYAAILAGTALLAVEQAYRASSIKIKLVLSGVGFVAFLCALLVYQPAAMMYWAFAAILLLTGKADLRNTWVRFIHYSLIAGAGLACEFAVLKLAPVVLGDNTTVTRSTLVTDYAAKSSWFIRSVMVDALNVYNVTPKHWIAILVATSVAIGIAAFVEGGWATRASKIGIAGALVVLCYLPNLLVQEDWASYRTQTALTSLIVLYLALSIVSVCKIRIPAVSLAAYAGLLALALVGGFSAARNVALDFVVPQYEELAFMRNQLASPQLDTATSVYLIPATWHDAFAPVVRYDEYGVVSSSVAWSEKPMVYFVLHDMHPRRDEIPVIVAPATGPFNPPPGSLVVDMRPLKNLAPFPPEFG